MSSEKFLDEVDGGLVRYLRSDATIRGYVGGDDANDTDARIFMGAARQGANTTHIVYVQTGGDKPVNHSGAEACSQPIVNIYAMSETPNTSWRLAKRIETLLAGLGTGADVELPDGTKVMVCNGSIVDQGYEDSEESSNVKKFYVRLVFRFLIA